ncbi:MAG: pirin family protein, partial [Alphaproteobacteria bacterium]|nr:pirin family protein [Alphaproteobacteria bacterium]
MSRLDAAKCTEESVPDCAPVDFVLVPKPKDIGAFSVRRVLPAAERRSVGPFVFFDQMGPAVFENDTYLDVRPHPHIGLSTITWMIEGEIMHRDSLGYVQRIRPGEVNWMTAGSGIVHSERTPDEGRQPGGRLYGIQTWIALPKDQEEIDPSFQHYAATDIPWIDGPGYRIGLIVGDAWGESSPVETPSETLYADISMEEGATVDLPTATEERAVYILSGAIDIAGTVFESGRMVVLHTGVSVSVTAEEESRLMLCGGERLDGP